MNSPVNPLFLSRYILTSHPDGDAPDRKCFRALSAFGRLANVANATDNRSASGIPLGLVRSFATLLFVYLALFFCRRAPRTKNPARIPVYVAADDLASCTDMRNVCSPMTNYTVQCNEDSMLLADVEQRNSRLSLLYLLADVFHLADSDFFVGTFSSHVARLVYELMQDGTRLRLSATLRAASLDDKWYYAG